VGRSDFSNGSLRQFITRLSSRILHAPLLLLQGDGIGQYIARITWQYGRISAKGYVAIAYFAIAPGPALYKGDGSIYVGRTIRDTLRIS